MLEKYTQPSKQLIYVSLLTDIFTPEKLKLVLDTLSNLNTPIIWNGKNMSDKYPDTMYIDNNKLRTIDVLCKYQ